MEDAFSPKSVLERLKQGTGSKTDKDLAEKLGVAQQSVYNVNAKNKVPESWVRKIAATYNLSTDWLYFGEGNMYRHDTPESLQKEALTDAIELLEEYLEGTKKKLPAKAKADLVCKMYQMTTEDDSEKRPIHIFRLLQGAVTADE